jgi:hypothetical protein
MEERPNQWIARLARVATIGLGPFTMQEDEGSLSDQIRGWEQDELKNMEQERLDKLESRRYLDHLKWKETEQEVRDESSG